MSEAAAAPASPIRLFAMAEEAAILCALLREPPVMPGKHAAYLELIELAARELPADPSADLWLHQAVSVAASFIRSPALLGRIVDRMLKTADTTIRALPAAYSSRTSSAIHAAVCAKNFEAVRVLIGAGHPLDEANSLWSANESAGASRDEVRGAMEMACTRLMKCLHEGDSAGALQLLMIVEVLSQQASTEAASHASTSLKIAFESILGTVSRDSGSVVHDDSAEIFYRLLDALLRMGADPSATLMDGSTPLHLAVKAHDWRCSAALVTFGADVAVRDAQGATPMDGVDASLTRLHSLRAVLRFAEIDKSFFS